MLGVLRRPASHQSTARPRRSPAVWPKIADVIQQINTAVGGLGILADKIFMHPRRWGFFEAASTRPNRPLFGRSTAPANYAT
jgi:hypothetical protein